MVVPIGFLCDHVEVLYDLDIEAAQVAREAGVRMERAATVGDHPQFIEMMAAIVASARCELSDETRRWLPPHTGRQTDRDKSECGVAMIGGGITGLAAAYRLRELRGRARNPARSHVARGQ